MLDRILTQPYDGNPLWFWVLVAVSIASALLLGPLAHWLLQGLGSCMGRTSSTSDSILVKTIKPPTVCLVMLVGLRFSLSIFITFADEFEEWIDLLYPLLVTSNVAWLVGRVLEASLEQEVGPRVQLVAPTITTIVLPLLRSILRLLIWVIAVLLGLHYTGYDANTILAGLGIGSLVVAMAAKDLVSDILGSMNIIILKPFKIGDIIEYQGCWATVVAFGMRMTTLQDFSSNYRIMVPNAYFINNAITNISSHPGYMVLMNIRLALTNSAENIRLALDLIRTIIDTHDATRFIWVKHDHFDEYAFVLRLHYDIVAFQDRIEVKSAINTEIVAQFQACGIALASLPLVASMSGLSDV